MDLRSDRFGIIAGLLLVLSFGMLLFPVNSSCEQSILTNLSMDDCDPFEARAIIMDVVSGEKQLIAAEQTIYVVDMELDGQRLITEMTDANGRPLEFRSLRRGQWIHIKGFKHIDGGVVALQVLKIDPPKGKRPVSRKLLDQRAPLQKTIKSASGS